MEDINRTLLRVCPVCGFSFNAFNTESRKQKIKCPMCGYEFPSTDVGPQYPKKGDKKFY
ncbi:MAG: hypothetical protein ACW986_11065 [Promethearchaeota archaeon]|jgi:rubredoxin